MSNTIGKILKKIWYVVAILIILVAAIANILRLGSYYLSHHPDQTNRWLSSLLKQPVTVQSLTLHWVGIRPAVQLNKVTVLSATSAKKLLTVEKIMVTLDPIRSLLMRHVSTKTVYIDGVVLSVDNKTQRYQVSNGAKHADQVEQDKHFPVKDGLAWLLEQPHVFLNNIQLYLHIHGKKLNLNPLYLEVAKQGNQHVLKATAYIINYDHAWVKLIASYQGGRFNFLEQPTRVFVQTTHFPLRLLDSKFAQGDFEGKAWLQFHHKKLQQLKATFKHLIFPGDGSLPKVTDLNGQVIWYPTNGQLQLTSQNADISWPGYFQGVMHNNHFDAVLDWQGKHFAHLKLGKLDWQNDLFVLHAKGSAGWKMHQLRHPIIVGSYQWTDLSKLKSLLPSSLFSMDLNQWLMSAFQAGQVSQAGFVWTPKHYQSVLQLTNMKVHYAAGWPSARWQRGQLSFDDGVMNIKVNHAKVDQMAVDHLGIHVAPLRNGVLTARIKSHDAFSHALALIQDSPMTLAKKLKMLQGAGPVGVDIQLTMPLYNGMPVSVKGKINWNESSLLLPNWQTELKNLTGELDFDNSKLQATNLNASWLGTPLKLTIGTQKHDWGEETVINGNTLLDFSKFLTHYQLSAGQFVSGKAPAKLAIRLYSNKKVSDTIGLTSSLQGVKINLPHLYHKPEAESAKADLKLTMEPKVMRAELSYNNKLKAELNFFRKGSSLSLQNGVVGLGVKALPASLSTGLRVSINLPRLNLDTLLANYKSGDSSQVNQFSNLRQVDLKTKSLYFQGQHLSQVKATLVSKKRDWALNIDSNYLKGDLLWAPATDKSSAILTGNLSYFYWQNTDAGKRQKNSMDIKKIPNINLKIKQLVRSRHHYSNVVINTSQDKQGLNIDKLNFSVAGCMVKMHGFWYVVPAVQSNLVGRLQCQNYGQFFSDYQITNALLGGKGETTFALIWPTGLDDLHLKQMTGDIKFAWDDGSIIKLNKNTEAQLGLGKLLNIFSLQSLPQRLTLNFSDLQNSGFSFNTFKGEIKMKQGKANIDQLVIDGPVAKVQVAGKLNFLNQHYDLNLSVYPYVTSSIPLIATVAGGPIVGAAAFLINEAVSPGISDAIKQNLKLSGSWKERNQASLPAPN